MLSERVNNPVLLKCARARCKTCPFISNVGAFISLSSLRPCYTSCRGDVKAMLHQAIFLATSNATMTNKKPFKLQRACYTQATCLATLRKREGRSTFLATRNATIAVAKWRVTSEFFLATCKLEEKLPRVTWPLVLGKSLTFCTCTRSCVRANDAKIVRSRDAQCNIN